jgi:aarF domain-containing kinase
MYRSIVNSSRAALIVYRAVKDYELSLMGLEYNSEEYHQARHEVHMRVAESILKLSTSNRGIYLKLGQYLGNLEKVVPWEFTQVLKVLQDSAPPVPYEELKVVIENDLKTNAESLFRSIDTVAIASASLAQVHRAVLMDGQEVALKVQYPFLQVQSKWDLRVLGKITQLCNYLVNRSRDSHLNLLKLYDTWTSTLVEELDFKI